MKKSEIERKIKNLKEVLTIEKKSYLTNSKVKEIKSNIKYYKQILKLYNI